MTPERKRVYQSLGIMFVVIGLLFIAVSLAQSLFSFTYFSGNGVPVALFLLSIGGLLLWTVKDIEPPQEPDED